ncbi:MAG: CAP domain-containing protein [Anaerolineales bacterium]
MPQRSDGKPPVFGFAVAASLLIGCGSLPFLTPTATAPATSTPALPSPTPEEIETTAPDAVFGTFRYSRAELRGSAEAVVLLINRARGQLGLAPLRSESTLSDLAFLRSEDMVARDYFFHQDPMDGSTPADLLLPALGYGGLLSEIIFATTAPLPEVPQAALTWWMDSDVHRRNLLETRFHEVGIGLMGDGTWWKVTGLLAESGPSP